MRSSLVWFLESPKETRKAVRRYVTAAIFNVIYGMKVSGLDDEYVVIAEKALHGGSLAVVPGAYWVEFLPFLRHLPGWVPGNRAGKMAAEYKPIVEAMRSKPYDVIRKAMVRTSKTLKSYMAMIEFGQAEGRAALSVARTMLQRIQEQYGTTSVEVVAENHEIAKDVTGIAYGGGADTTTSSCESFLLAMALFPEVQKKAQAELDRVVGPNRLPDYDDYNSLVYIRAIVRETIRWMPPLPTGIPHRNITNDIYGGYFIPKGAMIIPNVWAMLHNPEDYPEPERFNPDRFIGEDGNINYAVRDPSTLTFGFRRRACPGRHFSNNTLFIFIASMLHAFDISPGMDELGKSVELSTEIMDGMLVGPCDVPCGLKPRSKEAERLIRDAAMGSGV